MDATSPPPLEPGWSKIALYGIPAVAVAAPVFFVQFYFLNFATDVLLLAPATVGVMLAAGRIWDAVTDPMAGYGSDRTRSRWGRRRPWIFVAAPASAIAFFAIWNPPASFESSWELAAWSTLWLLAFTTAVTAWGIPHQAFGAEMSKDANVRHRIFGLRFVTALVGVALSFGAMQLVGTAEDPRAMASLLAWAIAAGMAVILMLPALVLRDAPGRSTVVTTPPLPAVRDVVTNRNVLRLLAVWFIAQLGMASQGVIAPYMSIYVLKRPEMMGVMPALFIGPLVMSVPIWIALARSFGAKRVWRASMAAAGIAYAALFVLPADDFLWMAIMLGSAGFFTGCGGPLGPSFFASAADAEAKRTGERREGVYFAAKEFVEKASSAAVALIVGVVLQFSGFVPNVEQGPAAQLAIRACLSLLPGATFLIGALLLGRFEVEDAPALPAAAMRVRPSEA